jgi:hypothetical protein
MAGCTADRCRAGLMSASGYSLPTFLSNHVDGIAAVDLFVIPTIAFRILYCLVIMRWSIMGTLVRSLHSQLHLGANSRDVLAGVVSVEPTAAF